MKVYITGEDLIRETDISSHDLIYYINQKQITAYDQSNDKEIVWSDLESQFKLIQKLCLTNIVVMGVTQARNSNAAPFSYESRSLQYQTEKEHSRLDPQPAIYKLTSGVEMETPPVPWGQLLAMLQNDDYEIRIPYEQEEEIRKGWNNSVKLSYALKAMYLRSEIALLKQEKTIPEASPSKHTGPATTRENNLLKIIGALLLVSCPKTKEVYWKADGSPNLKSIEENILKQVSLHIDGDWIGTGTMRKTVIKPALEEIQPYLERK